MDWKTGKESYDDLHQLALYALYLQKEFHVASLENIEVRNEYLLTGTHRSYHLQDIDLRDVNELFRMSVNQMTTFLEDPTMNKPLSLHAFLKTEFEQKCDRCNFKELCELY